MAFTLPDLPYAHDALAPFMSAETLRYHHDKHHAAYVTKTNDLVAAESGLAGKSLVEVVRGAKPGTLFNNAAQLWNHSFLWQCLAPDAAAPNAALSDLMVKGFGSVDACINALADTATKHFASGWAWLVLKDGALAVTDYHDADTPIAHSGVAPLLAIDVWEHAYYIDHRNDRKAYVDMVLRKLTNWAFVAGNLDGKGASRADQAG